MTPQAPVGAKNKDKASTDGLYFLNEKTQLGRLRITFHLTLAQGMLIFVCSSCPSLSRVCLDLNLFDSDLQDAPSALFLRSLGIL